METQKFSVYCLLDLPWYSYISQPFLRKKKKNYIKILAILKEDPQLHIEIIWGKDIANVWSLL